MSFVSRAIAQGSKELFMEVKIDEKDISEKQKQMMEKVNNKPGKNEKKFVKITPLENLIQGNKYEFSLFGNVDQVKALSRNTVYNTDKDYTIFCKLEPEGDLIYRYKEGQITIFADYEGFTYESYPVEKDLHILIKHSKKEDAGGVFCGGITTNVKEIPKRSNKRIGEATYCEDSDKLRVLVVFTQNAQNSVPNIWQLSDMCIQQFNAACNNSGIGNVQAELVGPYFLGSFTETTQNVFVDVNNLADNVEMQNLRNMHYGDVVVLLSNFNYTPYLSGTRNYNADINNSYAVVKAPIANQNYAFVHTLSHLLSTRHSQCNVDPATLCDDNHPYSHSWKFSTYNWWSGTTFRNTLEHHVAYQDVFLNFSNPNISYMGQPTGTSINDNARRMSETFSTVKSYYTGPGNLKAYIFPTSGNYDPNSYYQTANTTYTFDGSGSCGVAPYYYTWEVSSNGSNFTAVDWDENFSIYLGEWDYKVVRLKVYSSDGQVAYKSVTLVSACVGCRIGVNEVVAQYTSNEPIKSNDFEVLKVFPNPAKEQLRVSLRVQQQAKIKVDLIDLQGRVIGTVTDKNYQSGLHELIYDCSSLAAGSYSCRLVIDGAFVKAEQLILSK